LFFRKKIYLFIDKPDKADDNAEHLYRYVKEKYPKRKIYFILNKSSTDWLRLEKEGFNLVSYAGFNHFIILLRAKYYISSHLPRYEGFLLSKKILFYFLNYKIIFLQHGVTHNDISNILNKHKIDLLITVSTNEYNNFIFNDNYNLKNDNVVLTGFPRYDSLLKKNLIDKKNIILIMPTWRAEFTIHSRTKVKNNFENSDYYMHWKSFLISDKLKILSSKYRIIFKPHAEMKKFIHLMNIPLFIEVENCNDISMQKIFKLSNILITDYSSVAFDMAILKKKIIYFQFDKKDFFKTNHIYKECYFDYKKDAFGKICTTLKELIDELDNQLENKTIEEKYIKRINTFFKFQDLNNSKRVFTEIENI